MSVLTKDVLNSIEKRYNRLLSKVFIETGTFKGETVSVIADMFSEIHTFELNERWYKEAVSKFKEQKHINCHYGDSAEGLKKVLSEINEPVVFWLDAHYCGPEASFGIEEVPLLRELAVIAPRKQKDIIIIDDAFLLGTSKRFEFENVPPFECNWGNITVESIKKAIRWTPNSLMVRHDNNLLLIFTNLTISDALQISESRINELNQILSSKQSQINSLESQIQQIQHSIPMQLVSRYQRIVDKLLRPSTCRRYYYDLGLTGIGVILNEGWGSFFTKAWSQLRRQSPFDARYARIFGDITLHDTLIEAIRGKAKRKSVIYDIGAFSGAYSIYLAHKVKQSRVYSFEPTPQAFNELIKNIEASGAKNITAMNVAISDHIGRQRFYVSSDPARSSFYPSNAAWENRKITQSIEVDCVTIDHLVESGKIPPPDIIKIDVEGHEFEVVKGAEETVRQFMPMIFYEPHGTPQVATSEIGTSSLLSKYGYECKSLGYPIWCYRKQVNSQLRRDKEVTEQ
jgi:FkbM family methyltransferase